MNLNNRLVMLLVVLLVSSGCGDTPPNPYSAVIAEGQAAANALLESTGAASISVAFIDGDRVAWAETFGYADRETSTPPTTETMYNIASVSKMLATVSTMKLVDQGLVSLDTPVTTYVPTFRMLSPEYTRVTVRMLLNHTSGFPGSDYRNSMTLSPYLQYVDQIMESLAGERLKHEPGYLSAYCNDGFSLLEKIITNVTGKTYVQFVTDEILTPLQMNHSRYAVEAFPEGSYANTYTDNQKNPFPFVNVYATGGLYSTPSDMGRFAAMILGNGTLGGVQILSPQAIEAMAEDQTLGTFNPVPADASRYGLGWDTVTEPGLSAVGVSGWYKSGDSGLYGTVMLLAPTARMAAVVSGVNGVGSTQALGVAERILLRALYERRLITQFPTPLASQPKPEREPTTAELEAISGTYAAHGILYRFDVNADTSLDIFKYNGTGWDAVKSNLKMRSNNHFSSDQEPLLEFSSVTAEGKTYVIMDQVGGYGHYQDANTFLEKIESPGVLSAAWQARLSKTWLLVNERSDVYPPSFDPRLNISEPTGLSGLISVSVHDGNFSTVDPSQSDTLADMMLILPQGGRDLNDLWIVSQGSEEWVRFGGSLYRPYETVPALAAPGGTVTIGEHGYAEWRAIASEGAAKRVTVTGARAWTLYTPEMTFITWEEGDASATLAATSGNYELVFFGDTGTNITITITDA